MSVLAVASLGDASLLQIARSVLLDTERGREVAASLAKRLLEQRLLPPNLAADLNVRHMLIHAITCILLSGCASEWLGLSPSWRVW
jgi:hypothetical protein